MLFDLKLELVKIGALYHGFDSALLTGMKLPALNISVLIS